MTIPNLTTRQVMVSFAFLAYSGEKITTPDPEPRIKQLIEAAMPQVPPIATGQKADWKIAWGPSTYTPPGGLYQDHMMYVVQSIADPGHYIVVIRGTNGSSAVDWLLDDFDVRQQIPWLDAAGAQHGSVSESTNIDLQTLLLLKDPFDAQHPTLVEFLTALPSAATNLGVTGHSKGGTMSSTLALYLLDHQAGWDPGGTTTVSNVSFAGPTAGDTAFATYSDSRFANPSSSPPGWDTSLQSNCDAVRNSLDVAPLAWNNNNWADIIAIYDPKILFRVPISTGLDKLAKPAFAALLTNKQGGALYQQIKPTQASLPGTFIGKGITFLQSFTTAAIKAYVKQGGVQHHAYPDLLGVPTVGKPGFIQPT